jgi:spore cortex formation protein SpoVR/YcgB (stage V sporulation)
MTNETIGIYDHATGENEVREMTDSEQAIRDAEVAESVAAKAAKAAEAEAVAEAKIEAAAKLTALGIDPKALGL